RSSRPPHRWANKKARGLAAPRFCVNQPRLARAVAARFQTGNRGATVVSCIAAILAPAGRIKPRLSDGPAVALVAIGAHLRIALTVTGIDVQIGPGAACEP